MVVYAFYLRPENRNEIVEEFTLIETRDCGFEEAREAKKTYTRFLQVLGHPGKLRVVPFNSIDEVPDSFPHEADLNEVWRENRSLVPFLPIP